MGRPVKEVRELDEVLAKHTARIDVSIRFLDIPFLIKTDSEELALKLRSYFDVWLSEDGSADSHIIYAFQGDGVYTTDKLQDVIRREGKNIKEAYYDSDDGRVVLKKRTGATLYIKGRERYVVGNLILHLHQLVNVIDEVYEEDFMDRGYVLFHASAVADREGHGILLTSASGVGKSTLALALVEQGFRFLSNDRVLARFEDDNVHLIGVPKKPRVNPGTILALASLNHIIPNEERLLYGSMGENELWQLEHKYDADVDAIYGKGTFTLEAMLSSIYVLNWKLGQAGPKLEIPPVDDAVDMIRPQVLSLDLRRRQAVNPSEAEEQLKSICRVVPIFNVKGGVNIAELTALIKKRQGLEYGPQ